YPQAPGPACNVRAFGAKGDGAADDSTAIQAAISAAGAALTGCVFFPPGTYLIRKTLRIGRRCSLVGAGKNDAIIKLGSAGMTGIQVQADEPITCRDLKFTSASQQTGGSTISLEGTAPGVSVNRHSLLHNVE